MRHSNDFQLSHKLQIIDDDIEVEELRLTWSLTHLCRRAELPG